MKKIISLISLLTLVLCILTGCGHTHTFADATCTVAKTCTECGEIEGEPLGHDWKWADCENPNICKRCLETQGESLGHDSVVGVCTKCGEFVNGDFAMETLNDLLDVNSDYIEPANDLISSADTSSLQDMYDKFTQAQYYLDDAYLQWQYTVDVWEDFNNAVSRSDFKNLFADVNSLMEAVPSGVNGSSYQDFIDYLEEYKQFLEVYQRFCWDAADFAEAMSYH